MQWAIVDGERSEAIPEHKGRSAKCPCCGTGVMPKCGNIVSWHWAHESADCDPWSEPESKWHRDWKSCFPEEWQEVIIGSHRADVQTPNTVIELQHSSISSETIKEREDFYKRMVWIVDAQGWHIDIRHHDGYATFRWKWPHKTWFAAKKPVFFDLGYRGVFEIRKLYDDLPCGGYGIMHRHRTQFLQRIRVLPQRLKSVFHTSSSSEILKEFDDDFTGYYRARRNEFIERLGVDFARAVITGKCEKPNRYTDKCFGDLKLIYYRWCNQYRIGCSICGDVLKVDGKNLNPMPHDIAELCKQYLEVQEISKDAQCGLRKMHPIIHKEWMEAV